MFTNLFFLILNLVLITSTLDVSPSLLPSQPGIAFLLLIGCYVAFSYFLYWQSSWLKNTKLYKKDQVLLIANIELLIFFIIYYFFVGAQHWIMMVLHPFGTTAFCLISLILYFSGLIIAQTPFETAQDRIQATKNTLQQTRFLFPFVIPFLIFTFLDDASTLFPEASLEALFGLSENSSWNLILYTLFNVIAILSIIILLPPLAVLIWGCPLMKESELTKELDTLCKQAHFKHGGFRIWTIMNSSLTAAIIGIVSKLRYILFTRKLLDTVPNRSIVAILAHEIGHSYYLHLFFYPFILLGMIITAGFIPALIYIPLIKNSGLEENLPAFIPVLFFILFGLTMALYFRFIFGYFSRIFERQADLHIFKLGIPACDMTDALDILATASGNIHNEPNWHHYGIQERIDFINQADRNRLLISEHARRVRYSLLIYFLILIPVVALLTNRFFFS